MKHPHYEIVHTVYQIFLYTLLWGFGFLVFVWLIYMLPSIKDWGFGFAANTVGVGRDELMNAALHMLTMSKFIYAFVLFPVTLGLYTWMSKFGKGKSGETKI